LVFGTIRYENMPMIERQPPAHMTWVFSAADYESARRARREFAAHLERCRAAEDGVQDSALIFGELVGNAVRHVGGQISAQLALNGTQPVLCVCDNAPASNLDVPERGPESESGRGLKIVLSLARRVWVERGASAKMVCAALPCDIDRWVSVEKGEVGR
jgi:anti-sigma regulatory factor (Ser/Thr protein kinase)